VKRCLVTGTAGFIGFHVAARLLERGHHVTGVDGLTPYYDVKLKEARHAQLGRYDHFRPYRCMLEDDVQLQALFRHVQPELVIHLAAQPGVRYSLEHRRPYIETNIIGTFNILEACRELRPQHILIASTSSVYGAAAKFPLSETDRADHPLTLYAASKKSMEVIAHCYAHLWALPISIFRFFTVYGPWGRPDMAPFKFVRNILEGHPIDVYNHGQMERDFTYIDDLVEAIFRLSEKIPTRADGDPIVATAGTSAVAPYRIVNIGGRQPVKLMDFIQEIERAVGRKAECNFMPMQPGEAVRTEASTEFLEALIDYRPATPISVGVPEYVRWYRDYYQT
jgi:UDP-glucuronate 4-epimerase